MAAPPLTPEIFTEKHIVVCEGKADWAFFKTFVYERGITGLQIIRPADGKDKFAARLNEIEVQVQSADVAHILLVIDNDSNAKKAFDDVVREIGKTGLYGEPKERLKPTKKRGRPSISVMCVPWGVRWSKMCGARRGNLETLILKVMLDTRAYDKEKACLTRYQNCTPAKDWPIGKQSKMKLRCLIAATCKKDPSCAPSDMWQSKKGFTPLMQDASFDVLEAFLREFATW